MPSPSSHQHSFELAHPRPSRPLTVLSVAYSLAAVRPDSCGGAEQVLRTMDEALVRAGHESIVIACEGSQVAGTLIATPAPKGALNREALERAQMAHRDAMLFALTACPVDLVHMHGQDFRQYLPPEDVPALVTLHVPRGWYDGLPEPRLNLTFNFVSDTQRRLWAGPLPTASVVENGVPLEKLAAQVSRRKFALCMGRIAPEKGFHRALDAAGRAGIPLLLAGGLNAYPEHERYFTAEIAPRMRQVRSKLLGPVGFARKRRLLSAAQCLLAPSQAPETSSLAAMEALACGTPVIAWPSGALAEIVEDGRTGFLVNSVAEMAAAIRRAHTIEPEACRAAARERFSAQRMAQHYLSLYERLVSREVRSAA